MKFIGPSATQLISYVARCVGKGAIIADWELEDYLSPLGCSKQKIEEALKFMSGEKGYPKILMREGNVYTVLEDPKNILCYVPADIADNLEARLINAKLMKEN